MKYKKIVSAVLAASMLVGSASNLIHPVLAKTDSDIEISTEVSTDGDILIESSGDDVVISNESDVSDEDIAISETESDIAIDDVTVSDGDTTDISITDTEQNTEDIEITDPDADIDVSEDVDSNTEDIVVESKDLLTASVSRNDKKNTLNTGTESVLTVKAENKSEKTAVFKVYFTNVTEELSDNTSEWEAYLMQPALHMQAKGLDDDCNLPVSILDADGNTVESSLAFLKEVKDDEIVSRYATMELPAGTSTEFDMTIWSDKNSTVTVIPVMEQDEAVYGEDVSVTWEKKLTFFDKFIQFFTGKSEEETDTDDIEISEVQGVEMDITGMEDSDFSSMRLVVMTDDVSVITDTDNIIGTYGNIYLLQFASVAETKNAYIRYKDRVTAIEPDKAIETASNTTEITVSNETETDVTDSIEDETDITVSDGDKLETDGSTEMDETGTTDGSYDTEQNPLTVLNEVEISTDVQNEQGVIALIDTGVNEHANVIDRVSVIDDVLVGGEHGDAMVDAIVSQNPDAKILSIRALDDNGFGTISSLVAAMEYAIEQDVDYINLSLYARTTLTTSVLKQEIIKATEAGIVVIGAAGNDGVDVKDYVPGSVEEAYIIGSATPEGFKQVLSNFGETVDYNVVADSTSEATALFTGYISAHGLESIADVLNQGLIYETNFAGDDIAIDTTKDVDFSGYTVDTTKSFVVRYTFANADKLKDGDTLASIYLEDRLDVLYATMLAKPEVYAVGDGTYKVKLNAPLINGYATSDYLDAEFACGNDFGQVVTEGVSLDMHTGIATIDESAFAKDGTEYDFADLQVQVLVPVNGIPERVIQNVTVVNSDSTEYTVKFPVYGLQIESIPLAIEGVNEELSETDFEVYINGEQTPVSKIVWDGDTHKLYVSGYHAAIVHSVKVVVKKDVDSVFQIAGYEYVNGDEYNYVNNSEYRDLNISFYLGENTDVSGLTAGTDTTAMSRIGSGTSDYPNQPTPTSILSTFDSLEYIGLDNGDHSIAAYIGIPLTLFGVDFQFYDASGNRHNNWEPKSSENGVSTYNAAIGCYCQHVGIASNMMNHTKEREVYYKILDTWEENGVTNFVMVMMSKEAYNDAPQSLGSVIRFAVKSSTPSTPPAPSPLTTSFEVTKVWADNEDSMGLRPGSVTVNLVCTNNNKVVQFAKLDESNHWKHTFEDVLVKDAAGTTYSYEVTEDGVANYTTNCSAFTGSDENGYTAAVTNTLSTGFLRIKKESAMPEMTNDNSCYSVINATYGVYTDEACTSANKVGELVTKDVYGYSNVLEVLPGTYYIKEIEASPGFELDTTVYDVTVTAGDTVDAPCVKTVKEQPKNDPMAITITKIWNGEQTDTIPTLEGTQFTVKYYDGYYDTAAQVSGLTPKRTWVIEVKYNSNIRKYMTQLSETYKVGGDDFYKNANGNVIVPLGTLTIQETKAAPGYTLDGEFMDANRNTFSPKDLYVTKVTEVDGMVRVQGGNEYSAEDDPQPSNIRIKKYDADGSSPLPGVTFELKDSAGTVVATATTDTNGIAEFADLYPDIYTITETETVTGHQLLKEPITVYAPMRVTEQEIIDNNIDRTQCVYDEVEDIYYIFNQTYEITNTVSFKMPMSGGEFDNRMFIPLGIGMVLLTGAFVILFCKKKELM